MVQTNIATIDSMLKAIDDALAAELPLGGIADAAALTALTGRVSDAETALGARALVTALDGEVQARTDAVSALQTDVNARIPTIEKGAASGVATLGVDGKIPASQLPALATTETFVVASQAEQLSLAAQPGDFAVRTDFNPHRNYILTTNDPTNFNNWRQLTSPGAVTSVDGMTGAVTLGSTATVANTLARRKPTGTLSIAAAQVEGEAVELAQFNAALVAALTSFGRDRGIGTELPTTDLRRGDVYQHTGLGCLMTYNGVGWRQVHPSGADPVGLSANYSAVLHSGFQTTFSGVSYAYDGAAWAVTGGIEVPDTEVTYAANWARYADTTIGWAGLRYWKVGGNVTVTGAFQATAATAAQAAICTLPQALWPKNPVQGQVGYHIRPNGLVVSGPARASGFVDSISFAYGVV